MSEKNRKDVELINQDYIKNMKFNYVKNMDEVIELALQKGKVKNSLDFVSLLKTPMPQQVQAVA
jgi:ATP-dependent Lon protease